MTGLEKNALRVEDLSVAYKPGRYIIKNMSFSVKKGSTAVLTGRSGCGKSTLCCALCGLMPSVIKADVSGRVVYSAPAGAEENAGGEKYPAETDIREADEAARAKLAGMVFQNPDDQIICPTVEDEIAFGLENLCVPYEEMRRRVYEQLRYFDIKHIALCDPSKLSGGQKKLVTIASVLAAEPEVIILDEPMTGLDEPARNIVRDAILKLRNDGRTLIIVEHWTDTVDYADEFIDMQKINNIQEM